MPNPTAAPDTGTSESTDLLDDLELLTVDEVAIRLRLKPWKVYQMCDDGVLPSVYLGRKSRRVKPADLRAYIDNLPTTRPAAAAS